MDQKYCLLHVASGHCHSVRTPLAQLLRHLEPAGFVQVHRSWLVQLSHIETVDSSTGIIRLPAKMEVPLGRAYRGELLNRLQLLD
jgi:DNA-binding LytR/AlgR family response regulator